MAGLGRKVFTAGEVLTAANVNDYLMDQAVQVYAGTAARGSALGTSVSEGQVTYLSDTDTIQVALGTATWANVASFSTATAGFTAISNGTAGLTYQPVSPNYIINGAFDFWQRGTSFANDGYTADRFRVGNSVSSVTTTRGSFTPADLNIIGFGEADYFARVAVTSSAGAGNFAQFLQRVENVKNLAGQTVTFSYWAKADAAKSVSLELQQNFGSGGSSSVNTFIVKQALTTSWARYSHTFTVPSVSGKTIGSGSFSDFRWWLDAGSNFDSRTNSLGQQNITFDVWGVQLEAGSVATPFKRAANTLQGELAACQRYFYNSMVDGIIGVPGAVRTRASRADTFILDLQAMFPVPMRATPTMTWYSITPTSGNITVANANRSVTGTFDIRSNNTGIIEVSSAVADGNDLQANFTASAEL